MIDITSILKAIGPAASIIFAAWIFMGFVQQRYDAAVDRYRETISQYRRDDIPRVRRTNIREQIVLYKQRCELMARAIIVGLVAAIMLILTLIAGELDILFPKTVALQFVCAASALVGFALVIAAALIIIFEARITFRQLANELLDVPDLAESAGHRAGRVTDDRRAVTAK